MLKNLLRLTAFVWVTLTFVVTAIGAQPHNDSDLQTFLFPAECHQPCVMGVEIGKSSTLEAAAILEQHEWVASVDVGSYVVTWRWTDAAPAYIDRHTAGWMRVVYGGSVVNSAYIRTRVDSGKLQLMLGRPSGGYVEPAVMGGYDVSVGYPEQHIHLTNRGVATCPITSADLHFTHVEVSWVADVAEQPNVQDWSTLLPHRDC